MKFETMYKGFKTEFDSIKGKYIAYDKEGDVIKEAKVVDKAKKQGIVTDISDFRNRNPKDIA